VDPAEDDADDRHEDVIDERIDDRPEGAADDDADGKVHDVAARDKCLEFIEHSIGPLLQ